ncbi:MAG: lipid-A-disaccharide synthase, partial [Gammaproteobacteria bacterium]
SNCKKAICASGTVTLQLAILEVPMVIMYKLSLITYFVMKSLVKLKYIGLVNLVLGDTIGSKPIVKEFIQPSYSDQIDVMVELNKIDNDNKYRQDMINMYKEIKSSLSGKSQDNLNSIINRLLNVI